MDAAFAGLTLPDEEKIFWTVVRTALRRWTSAAATFKLTKGASSPHLNTTLRPTLGCQDFFRISLKAFKDETLSLDSI